MQVNFKIKKKNDVFLSRIALNNFIDKKTSLKNFVLCIININLKDLFMVLPDEVSEYLQHIVTSIRSAMPVSAIYLFGSYATGHFHEDSDLDIYIVTPDKSKRKVEISRDARIAIGTPKKYPMDILVGYEEDFERRRELINTLEREVFVKGIKISANS